MLRTVLAKEAGEVAGAGFMAYHMFENVTLQQISKRIPRTKEELLEISGIGKVRLNKFGDRLLETIEATIKEYYNTGINSSSNDSTDLLKRRRDTVGFSVESLRLCFRTAYVISTTGLAKCMAAAYINNWTEAAKCMAAAYKSDYNELLEQCENDEDNVASDIVNNWTSKVHGCCL
ncbi:hypothetical protein F0562_020237 [Nyssa sinensis]|uniref:HRDC domain-containing protein n=1 Tax=Nyssa sinensis TaxID=561372 RepID=A0A5J5BQK5_9ASTE|nr:hypothetical protein F0562_020237 [Nyssa sinensis]